MTSGFSVLASTSGSSTMAGRRLANRPSSLAQAQDRDLRAACRSRACPIAGRRPTPNSTASACIRLASTFVGDRRRRARRCAAPPTRSSVSVERHVPPAVHPVDDPADLAHDLRPDPVAGQEQQALVGRHHGCIARDTARWRAASRALALARWRLVGRRSRGARCMVWPMSSRPFSSRCLRNGSISNAISSPLGRTTTWRARSIGDAGVAAHAWRPPSAGRRPRAAGAIGRMPFLKQLLWKMSAKLGAITQRMPKSSSAQGACSRDEPQPKFSCAIRISAWRYGSAG